MVFTKMTVLLWLLIVEMTVAEIGQHTANLPDSSVYSEPMPEGHFASSPTSYEIVTPIRVTSEGNFLSHDLKYTHPFTGAELSKGRRRKREVAPNADENAAEDHKVHYLVHIEGKPHMVELEPNRVFLPSHAVVERRSRLNATSDAKEANTIGTVTSEVSVIGTLPRCHFVGRVFNHTLSKVALSACDGLKGYLKTDSGEFLIEPLIRDSSNENVVHPQPHKVYRRPSVTLDSHQKPDGTGECGSQNFENAIKEREEWERRTKKGNLNGGTPKKRRSKRSVSVERNVEVLVVADKEMIDFYSNEDLNTYILTIMNMVSSIYHDASIGNAVNIIVVRIMLLETPQYEEELDISHEADSTLASFCQWQQMVNPSSEDHPHHHDVAVLLTRYNICSKSNVHCSTLGLAEIAGMCQPHRSCNVNEDTGLQIAYTIAHELGHNFGMNHDSLKNGCGSSFGISQHVMSPHLATDAVPMTWSNCSRNEITKFLDREWGTCLVDEPPEVEYNFPQLPPGAMYDANHQCRLAFGAKAYHCKGIEMECQTLWCRVNNRCVTRLEPAAEGTQCAKHKWCYFGECVTMGDRPAAIHGSWGQWSSWSGCSRSCGAGVEVATRHCNNPSPANGGKYCTGDRRKYRICNTEECPDNGVSFRAVQCSAFDNEPYKGRNHTWGPVTLDRNPCQLHCKPDNEFYSVELKDSVLDGTPCKPGTRDMCIHGICKRIACDWTIEGRAQEDRCGLCHGDGTQCVTTSGIFNVTSGVSYVSIVTFPKGVRNGRVEELGDAANYLAVRDEITGKFYLNGNWIIQWSGEYSAAGTMMYYKRENETETLFFPGPVKKPLTLMLLFQTENPGIQWEYTLPHENATYTPEFHWRLSDWSVCTCTCGGGTQLSKVQCREKEAGLVEDKYCENTTRPDDKTRECNTHACPAWWWSGPWQPCSLTCGDRGTRRRTVICVRSYGPTEQMALMDSDCSMSQKPHEQEQCPDLLPCPTDLSWTVGPWIKSCRGDPCEVEKRRVICNKALGDCNPRTRPTNIRQCGNITCGHWETGEWGECSSSCGEGFQIRKVECIDGVACTQIQEPGSVRECKVIDCSPLTIEETLSKLNNVVQTNHSNNQTNNESHVKETTHGQTNVEENVDRNENERKIPKDNEITVDKLPQEISSDVEQKPLISPVIDSTREKKIQNNISDNGTIDKKNISSRDEDESIFTDTELPTEVELERTNAEKKEGKGEERDSEEVKEEKNFTIRDNKEAIGSQDIGEGRGSIDRTIDDSKSDSPSYYETTPDEYYEFDPADDSEKETSLGEGVSTTDEENIEVNTTVKEGERVDTNNQKDDTKMNITVVKGVEMNTTYVHKEEVVLQNDTEEETKENGLSTDSKESTLNESIIESNKDTGSNKNMSDEMPQSTQLDETSEDATVIEESVKNEIVPEYITNDSLQENENDNYTITFEDEDYNYDDNHIFSDAFAPLQENSNPTSNETTLERPQGFIEDKVDIDDMQVIEIKLKKKKKKHKRRHQKQQEIKKIKVHTGTDAMRVLKKFTKKANSKKTKSVPVPSVFSDEENPINTINKWIIGPWSECSEPCGGGVKRRAVECQNSSTGAVEQSWKCHALPPPDLQYCNKIECLNWTTDAFGPCSETCGRGTRTRKISCPEEGRCHPKDMPPAQEGCQERPCVKWVEGPWSMCTKSCGGGYQIRFVKCVDVMTQEASQECEGERPLHKRDCNNNKCQQKRQGLQSHCNDLLDTKLCRRLKHMCSSKFIGVKCCKTCHRGRG